MASRIQQVQSKGIYHGLPVFPAEAKDRTAIVTGANGISGAHMVKVLGESPERWSKIWCLSRRPPMIPGGLPVNATFISVDFMRNPKEIAQVLKEHGVDGADAVFFYSYIQVEPGPGESMWPAEAMTRENTALLKNFLDALALTPKVPKRFMLQTGAKNYSCHLGPTKLPQKESHPRVELESNFYFPQEDALRAWCEKFGSKYSIAMPCGILGAVPDNAMNLCLPLAVYCTVQAYLGRPIEYSAGPDELQRAQDQSSAMLNSYLEEWSVLIDQDEIGESYNVVDGSPFTWEDFWPQLAAWFGTEWRGPKQEGLNVVTTPYDPPPRGYGGPGKITSSFLFTEWAKDPATQKAWSEIAAKHDLRYRELAEPDRVFGFLDGMMLMPSPLHFSMDKAHKRGWLGTVDTHECILEVFNQFAEMKMIPPLPKGAAKP